MQVRAFICLRLQLTLLYKQVRVIFFSQPRAWWYLSARHHTGDEETLLYGQRMTLQTSCYMLWGRGEPWIAHLFISNINQNPNPPSLGRKAIDVHSLFLAFPSKFFCSLIRQPNVWVFLEFSFGCRYLKSKEVLPQGCSILFRSGCLNTFFFFFTSVT